VAYWDGHQTQADAITDIVSCELYNNIMVFNKNITGKRCYDFRNIINSYSELIPYLKWTDSIPLRIVSNGAGIPVYKKGIISITMTSDSLYQFAILLFNSEKTKVYDSGWFDTLTKEITEEDVQFIQIWFRDRNNNILNNDIIQDINQYVSQISIDGLVFVDNGIIPSLDLLNNEILKTENGLRKEILRPIISVSHQGYSVTSQYYGNCRISSFKASAKHGFDWAETDVKFSQDNVPVCSHDETFTDIVTGEVIVIADHTFAELETYNYYGEKIASLDEVVKTCKLEGLNLVIDHIGYINTESKWSTVFGIIQKYNMADRIGWSVNYDNTNIAQSVIDEILNFYAGSRILITCLAITQDKIDLANSSKTQQNKVSVFCDNNYATVSDIIACNSQLLNGVTVWVWTIDNATVYKSYAPYVEAIYSNKISSPMLDLDE
jgi:glycerophosphoryl diester phosphodiesterase